MARFNAKSGPKKQRVARPDTTNLAGGAGYTLSPKAALATTVLSSMLSDTAYEAADTRIERIRQLASSVEPEFAAKLAVMARNEYGLRSVTHVLGACLMGGASGTDWARDFYTALVRRPDDMIEMVALLDGKLSSAMKKGFARAFDKFDTYQLAKYRADGRRVNLTDIMRLVHPVPIDRNREGILGLVNGDLRQQDTWESELSAGGDKAAVWKRLLLENRLGYFALLRNLRNIGTACPDDVVDLALSQLTDPERIAGSLVMPFRYQTAHEALWQDGLAVVHRRKMVSAVEKACEIALSNVPPLEGKTAVAVDCSGSMRGAPIMRASLFAAAMAKRWDCDVMTFSSAAHWFPGSYSGPMLTLAGAIRENVKMAGTDFETIFKLIGKDTSYERVVVLSDMQGWAERHWASSLNESFDRWRKETGAYPKIYSWDLQGYGVAKFPEKNAYLLSGFSDKVFELMAALETEPEALVSRIESVAFA